MKKHSSKALRPVSRKFYTYISDRVRESMSLTGREDAADEAMTCIDRYLTDGSVPSDDADPAVRLTFTLLRPEIDKAIGRSSRARKRHRATEMSPEKSNTKATYPAEPHSINTNPAADSFHNTTTEDEEESAKPFVPRNRRERRLYEQELRRATKRLTRRLVKSAYADYGLSIVTA